MDKEERYAREALEALQGAAQQLDQAHWRLNFVGDYEQAARVDALHRLLVAVTPGLV